MVRREVVVAKVGRARVWLNDAEATFRSPLETVLSEPKSRDLALFYLFLAIQECIDLAAHWVGLARSPWPLAPGEIATDNQGLLSVKCGSEGVRE